MTLVTLLEKTLSVSASPEGLRYTINGEERSARCTPGLLDQSIPRLLIARAGQRRKIWQSGLASRRSPRCEDAPGARCGTTARRAPRRTAERAARVSRPAPRSSTAPTDALMASALFASLAAGARSG